MSKKIIVQSYESLILELQKHITKTQNNIIEIITRQKVEMAWLIGESIEKHLIENNQSAYGKALFKKLENDIGISQSVLYRMCNFYKTYPKLPKDDGKLNWSHYRILSGVKEDEERKYLQKLTSNNAWNADRLRIEVAKSKDSPITKDQVKESKVKKISRLVPPRGKLFTYKLTKMGTQDKTYIDCGFNLFKEFDGKLSPSLEKSLENSDQIVESKKDGESYSFTSLNISSSKLHIYKAKLEKVVDGDTIHVILDLGFKNFHREILRLAKINAPESKTVAGKKSTAVLKKILKNVPFLVIKTNKVDIYGRYVADVFLAEAGDLQDVQKVADEGIYLNQLLLDRKVAVAFM
jgi:hypothetical protein